MTDMRVQYLFDNHFDRLERAAEKEAIILEFLRDEIYSSAEVLALLLDVGKQAAQVTLRRMAAKGLVVKDEVPVLVSKRTIPIWGITFEGVMTGLDPHRIATEPLRHHKVGSAKLSTLGHTLGVQRCRSWWQGNEFRSVRVSHWTVENRLPSHDLPGNDHRRWKKYPDAYMRFLPDSEELGSYEPDWVLPEREGVNLQEIMQQGGYGIAIEVELTRKSLGRYATIIAEHLHNIRQNRYHFVWYYCKNSVDAKSYQQLFIRLAIKDKIQFHDPHSYTAYNPTDTIKHFFQFWSLETMKRI